MSIPDRRRPGAARRDHTPASVRNQQIILLVTLDELHEIDRAAVKQERTRSSWARLALLRAVVEEREAPAAVSA